MFTPFNSYAILDSLEVPLLAPVFCSLSLCRDFLLSSLCSRVYFNYWLLYVQSFPQITSGYYDLCWLLTVELHITMQVVSVSDFRPVTVRLHLRSPRVNTLSFIPSICRIYCIALGHFRISFWIANSSVLYSLTFASCSSDRNFAADFLQIPPHDGHPCLKLTLLDASRVRDLHPIDNAPAGRTTFRAIRHFWKLDTRYVVILLKVRLPFT